MSGRIVVACSGRASGMDAIAALVRARRDVVALSLDLGQGGDLEEVRDRALDAGASRAHVLDVRDEFANAFVLPALHAGAHAESPGLAVPLGHALLARKLVEVADIESAGAVGHGCAGPARERLERSVRSLRRDLHVIAPDAGAPPAGGARGNLWGAVIEQAGADPAIQTTLDARARTGAGPAVVELAFVEGVPCAVNGVTLSVTELIDSVATIAAQQNVGRAAAPDSAGLVHEAPAAAVLHAAHDALEARTGSPELVRVKRELRRVYARLVLDGSWFTPLREAVDAFNAVVQRDVTGTVRVELHDGRLVVADCSGPLATTDTSAGGNGTAARPFATQPS